MDPRIAVVPIDMDRASCGHCLGTRLVRIVRSPAAVHGSSAAW